MKILFTTDLHGDKSKYNRILDLALENEVDVVINSGDILPVNIDLTQQGRFITEFLDMHFARFERSNIYYLTFMANDDLKRFDQLFDVTCHKYSYVNNIALKKFVIGKFEFIGMNLVCDYPYRLKDRCRMDTSEYEFNEQYGKGLLSTNSGWIDIEDWPEYARTLPSLDEELEKLVEPDNRDLCVYVMHMPPYGLGLDIDHHKKPVGSRSIYDFLKNNKPLLSLHGHIHCSPNVSGKWKEKLGPTMVIQPGQLDDGLAYVLGDIESLEFRRIVEKLV